MKSAIIESIEKSYFRKNPLPHFIAGDTVCVWVKILESIDKEGKPKYRLQAFEGVCIRYRKGTTNATFLVRKISAGGIAVERNFFVHSPMVDSVQVKSRGKVRRARLYYLRDLKGKAAKVKTRLFSSESSSATITPIADHSATETIPAAE